MMVRTKIFVKEDTKMLYTEKEKHEIERVKEVFAEHLRQSPDFELLWSDKVGYPHRNAQLTPGNPQPSDAMEPGRH